MTTYGTLIDGRNRQEACKRAGIKPVYENAERPGSGDIYLVTKRSTPTHDQGAASDDRGQDTGTHSRVTPLPWWNRCL
jgi:hypothetical protein